MADNTVPPRKISKPKTPTGPVLPKGTVKGALPKIQGARPVSLEELTYDQAAERFKGTAVRLPDRKTYEQMAAAPETEAWRSKATLEDNAWRSREARRSIESDQIASESAMNSKLQKYQEDLAALGQGHRDATGKLDVAADYQNLAEISLALMSLEGDTEEEKQARAVAAATLHDHMKDLAPHIKALDPDGQWWSKNYKKINATLDELDAADEGWKQRALRGTGIALNFGPIKYVLEGLNQTGAGAAHTIAGVRSALDPNDPISVREGLQYAASSALRGGEGLALYGTGLANVPGAVDRLGMTDDRLIQGGDTLYSMDQDQSGDLNLREAIGRDANKGGRVAGLFDTIGLGATDPLSWASLGQGAVVKGTLRSLARSGEQTAVKAGLRLAAGVAYDELDDVERAAVKAVIQRSAAEGLANASPTMLARKGIKDPSVLIKRLTGAAKDTEAWRNMLIESRTEAIENAVRRGSVPGLHVGGTTVIPMRRFYNALGIIDSRLASPDGWAKQLLKTADLEDTDELLSFIQTYDPSTEMPAGLKRQVRRWSAVADRMGQPPEVWLDDLLQRAEDPVEAFDQIEAFGRALLDDRVVNDWRPWFESSFRPDVIDTEHGFKVVERGADARQSIDDWYREQVDLVNREYETVAGDLIDLEDPEFTVRSSDGGDVIDLNEPYLNDPAFSDDTVIDLNPSAEGQDPGALIDLYQGGNNAAAQQGLADQAWRDMIKSERAAWESRRAEAAASRDRQLAELEAERARRLAGSPTGFSSEGSDYLANRLLAGGELSESAQRILGEDMVPSLRRRIAALSPDDLSHEAQLRIARNREVFENPERWIIKDFEPRGLRSITSRDDILGRLTRRISDAFSTGARIRRGRFTGGHTAELVNEEMVLASARRNLMADHINRMGLDAKGRSSVAKAAQAELRTNGNDADVWEAVTRYLTENEDNIPAIVDQLKANGMPKLAQMVDTLQSIREDIFQLSVLSGADEAILLDRKGYLPRVWTQEARDAADKALRSGDSTLIQKFKDLGLIGDDERVVGHLNPLEQGGHLEGRRYMKDVEDLFAVNKQAREELASSGLIDPDGTFKLYEDNPMRAILVRSRQANDAYVYHSLVEGLSKVEDMAGRPLAYVARTADDVPDVAFRMAADAADFGKADYVVRNLPGGGKLHIQRDVAHEIENARRIMGNPNTRGTWRGFMESWNTLWGAYATVPIIGGIGFHMRNATGNIYNMILAGATNPVLLKDAYEMQHRMSGVIKAMRETGDSFETALAREVEDEGTRTLMSNLRKYDILGGGQTADIFDNSFDPLRARGRRKGPFDPSNRVVNSGRRLGTAIENNARTALFIDGMNKGLSPADSATRVRQYLFDYSDLTKFEADNVRMLSRFYTFMRKNTALQARLLVEQPGRIVNANRVMQEFMDASLGLAGVGGEGQEVEGGPMGDGRVIPDWAQATLRLYGRDTLAGVDTPFASGLETADTLAAVLKTPGNLLLALASDDKDRARHLGEMRDNLRQGLTLLSGGPMEGVRTLFEEATGVDTFTGAKLDDKDRTSVDIMTRLVDTVFPIAGKLDREAEYLGLWSKLGVMQDPEMPDRDQGKLRLLNTLLGFTVVTGIDDEETKARNMMMLQSELYHALDDARDELGAAGIDVPTYDDLVRAGEATARNDAMDFLLYNTMAGEPLTDKQKERLLDLIPKEVAEAAGLNKPTAERAKWDLNQRASRVREMMTALEGLGYDVTEDDIQSMILRESGARVSDVKDMGIMPSYRDNPYLKAATPDDYQAQRRAQSEEQLTALAQVFGITVDELKASRPLLQPAQEKVAQMREAGYTEEQMIEELTKGLSRQEQAMLYGETSLEKSFAYKPLTSEEVLFQQRKAAAAEAELRVMMQLSFGHQPTQDQINEWLSEVMLTAPEQRKIGYEDYRAPSRDNVTTDEVYAERLRQKLEAMESSTTWED